jgi:hypothetical protein
VQVRVRLVGGERMHAADPAGVEHAGADGKANEQQRQDVHALVPEGTILDFVSRRGAGVGRHPVPA